MTKLFGNIKKKKFALTSNDSKFLKVHFFHHKKNFKRNLVINTFVGNSFMNVISGSNCILLPKKKKTFLRCASSNIALAFGIREPWSEDVQFFHFVEENIWNSEYEYALFCYRILFFVFLEVHITYVFA